MPDSARTPSVAAGWAYRSRQVGGEVERFWERQKPGCPGVLERVFEGGSATRTGPATGTASVAPGSSHHPSKRIAPRVTATSALIARGRALRARAESDEVPELHPNAEPTVTVSLTLLAREVIEKELARSRSFVEEYDGETGGWLFGEREGHKWLVSATDLGAGKRSVKRVDLDHEQVRHEAYRATLDPRSRVRRKFLGAWHVHPTLGSTAPSAPDRRNALRGLESRELNPAEFALDLIISPHAHRGWNSPQFHAWVTRRDRWAGAITEPATIEGPTR